MMKFLKTKGYVPELAFQYRQEILESVRYVDEVIPAPWLIDDHFLDRHHIDLLVHGHDNSNQIDPSRTITFARTEGISSSDIRESVATAYLSSCQSEKIFSDNLRFLCQQLLSKN